MAGLVDAKEKTVTAPFPAGPPASSPTAAVCPFPERATEVPKTMELAGGVRAVPEDQVPLKSNTVAVPNGDTSPVIGSPTSASVPPAVTATQLPKCVAVAGGASAVGPDHETPLLL